MGLSESITHAQRNLRAAPAVVPPGWTPADLLLQTEETERRHHGDTQQEIRQ